MSAAQCLSTWSRDQVLLAWHNVKHNGTKEAKSWKLWAVPCLSLLVRTPLTTVGTLPELGNDVWIRAGASWRSTQGWRGAGCPWPQRVSCADGWRFTRKINELFGSEKPAVSLRCPGVCRAVCGRNDRSASLCPTTLTGSLDVKGDFLRESAGKFICASSYSPTPSPLTPGKWEPVFGLI